MPSPTNDPMANTRVKLLSGLIEKHSVRLGKFVAIGCGAGWLVGTLRARGVEATGIDIANSAIEFARRQYPEATFQVMELGIDSLPIDAETINVARSFGVVEHLMDLRR